MILHNASEATALQTEMAQLVSKLFAIALTFFIVIVVLHKLNLKIGNFTAMLSHVSEDNATVEYGNKK